MASLLCDAYNQAATVGCAKNGFEKCGLWPVNPDVFHETDFVRLVSSEEECQTGDNIPADTSVDSASVQNECWNAHHISLARPAVVSTPHEDCQPQPSSPNQSEVQPDLCVIPVEGDGMCFSDASSRLPRRSCNEPIEVNMVKYQTAFTDCWRQRGVTNYEQRLSSLWSRTWTSSTMTRASIINANQPVHIRYVNVHNRLTHMAMTTPGEMEVSAAAAYLEKTIVIYTTNRAIVNTYGSQHSLNGTIRLQFTTVGTDVGHYDLLNIERANHEPVSPVTQSVPVTMTSTIPKRKRKQRSYATSIVLTASPYKTQLTNKTPRDKTRVQKQKKPNVRGNKVGENKKGKKQISKSRSSSDPSWVCSLCGDCSVESMICCVKCQNWVHVACADQDADMITYCCDLCA